MPDPEREVVALLRDLRSLDGGTAGDPAPRRGTAGMLARLQAHGSDWTVWLERHELAGYCFALLRDTDLEDALGPDAHRLLERAHRRQVRRNRRLLSLLLALNAKLADARVPFLLIKGFPLSARFAGGLDRRLMWDQDILIRPQDLGPVMATANSLGLRARAGTEPDPTRLTRVLHAIELHDDRHKLDIHWVFRNRRAMRLGYDDVVGAAQPLILDGTRVQAVSDLDLLTISCLSLINDMERSHVRLRKVWDIYLMASRLDDAVDWHGWLERPDVRPLQRTLLNVISFCLALTAADQDCPRLRAVLEERTEVLLIRNRSLALRITQRPRQSLGNRWLMARLQPVPASAYWAWWLATLPIRFWHGRQV